MNKIKKFVKELESKKKKFDPMDGIFVLSFSCFLFKSEFLTNINAEENRKPDGENWMGTWTAFQDFSVATEIDDKLLYLKPLIHSFDIIGSINLNFTRFTLMPLNTTFKDFYLIDEYERHKVLREKCLTGHELLHLRTNTKIWVSETMIEYIC